MEKPFCVPYGELRQQGSLEINHSAPAAFMEVEEPYMGFTGEIQVQGRCELMDQGISLLLDIEAKTIQPCTVCNENTSATISIKQLHHFEKNPETCNNVFDFNDIVREAVLLETPEFIECLEGNCEARNDVKKYLKEDNDGSTKR